MPIRVYSGSETPLQCLGGETALYERVLGDVMRVIVVNEFVVIDLQEVLKDPSSNNNFELRAGDRLVIENRPDSVNIMGEVYNPTAVLSEKKKTVGYYLGKVGGMTPDADEKRLYLVKVNGTVISKSQEGFFGMTSWDEENSRWVMGFESVSVDPGATIFLRKKLEWNPVLIMEVPFPI